MIHSQRNPTVEIPSYEDPTVQIFSPNTTSYFSALTSFENDEFRIYEFKVRKCARARSHDWTHCPFAHPGEKARRRDPRRRPYSGVSCPDFRRGGCPKGDTCHFAHGVFELWLHPDRYRTEVCKDGPNCQRRVCFFAHSLSQLRVVGTGRVDPDEIVGRMGRLVIGEGPGLGARMSEFRLDEDGVLMERVESGRDLRARVYGKVSQENSSDCVRNRVDLDSGLGLDFGWISELVK